MTDKPIEIIAAVVFAIALLHTFSAPLFLRLAHRSKRHEGLLHLLGEVEVVFGFWAAILLLLMAFAASGDAELEIDMPSLDLIRLMATVRQRDIPPPQPCLRVDLQALIRRVLVPADAPAHLYDLVRHVVMARLWIEVARA